MKDILIYYAKILSSYSQSLNKKSLLIDKPWMFIDEDGVMKKLIFKRDKGLIISKKGLVTEGSWDHYPKVGSLLIKRSVDKLLLNEKYVDDNVLILEKDGTDNEFYALANENTIIYSDIPRYLDSIKCKKFKILNETLLSGEVIQIFYAKGKNYPDEYQDLKVERIDNDFNISDIPDGKYLTNTKSKTIYLSNNRILFGTRNIIMEFDDGRPIEIENGNQDSIRDNIGKTVTINGDPLESGCFKIRSTLHDNMFFHINDSVVANIVFVNTYLLNNGKNISIEQKYHNEITKGDKIIKSSHNLIPDGKYSLKERIFKIKVKDYRIV